MEEITLDWASTAAATVACALAFTIGRMTGQEAAVEAAIQEFKIGWYRAGDRVPVTVDHDPR